MDNWPRLNLGTSLPMLYMDQNLTFLDQLRLDGRTSFLPCSKNCKSMLLSCPFRTKSNRNFKYRLSKVKTSLTLVTIPLIHDLCTYWSFIIMSPPKMRPQEWKIRLHQNNIFTSTKTSCDGWEDFQERQRGLYLALAWLLLFWSGCNYFLRWWTNLSALNVTLL